MSSRQVGFWEFEDRLRDLSAHGDPLERLSLTVDFEMTVSGYAAIWLAKSIRYSSVMCW